MQANYLSDPNLYPSCCHLIDNVFPGAGVLFDTGISLGADLKRISTPFIIEQQGSIIAHVGVIFINVQSLGKNFQVGALHAVCVDESYRKQGHFKTLMQEVMPYIAAHSDLALLFTDHPEIYDSFQFHSVSEFDYALKLNRETKHSPNTTQLDLYKPSHFEIIKKLFQENKPLSAELNIQHFELFILNCIYRNLYYSAADNLILIYKQEKHVVYLEYLLCEDIPTIDTLLKLMPKGTKEIIFQFKIDQLNLENIQRIPANTLGYVMINQSHQLSLNDFRIPEVFRC